jgi:hypothetical protein
VNARALCLAAALAWLAPARLAAYQGGALPNHSHTTAAGQGGGLSASAISAAGGALLGADQAFTGDNSHAGAESFNGTVNLNGAVNWSLSMSSEAVPATTGTDTAFNICKATVTMTVHAGRKLWVSANLQVKNNTLNQITGWAILTDRNYIPGYDATHGFIAEQQQLADRRVNLSGTISIPNPGAGLHSFCISIAVDGGTWTTDNYLASNYFVVFETP